MKRNIKTTLTTPFYYWDTFPVVLLLCFFLTTFQQDSLAQEYIANVQYFGLNEGISHRGVRCSTQDSRGFVWVGTKYGLNRFDGRYFEIFTKEKHGLPFNEFACIIEDSEGWLWLFKSINSDVNEGQIKVAFINIHTKEVQSFEERFGTDLPFNPNKILSFLKEENGTLYFGTGEGNIIKYTGNNTFELLPVQDGNQIILSDITSNGVLILKNEFERLRGDFFGLDTLGNRIWTLNSADDYYHIGEDQNAKRWLWSFNSFTKNETLDFVFINDENGEISAAQKIAHPESRSFSGGRSIIAAYKKEGYFLFADANIFFLFHPEKGILLNFNDDYPQIAKSNINHIDFDNRNNTWINTDDGLYKIQIKQNQFKTFLSQSKKDFNINTSFSARGMLKHQNFLFATGEEQNRKFQIDLSTGEALRLGFINRNNINAKGHNFGLHVVIPINETEVLFGAGNCQVVYDIYTKDFKILKNDPIFGFERTWSLFQDSYGQFWSGIENRGLAYWDQTIDSLLQYKKYNAFPEFLNCTIYAFHELDDQHILLGSNLGIYVFHQEKGIIHRFWDKGAEGKQLPFYTYYHILKDKEQEGLFWVASSGGGLFKVKLQQL